MIKQLGKQDLFVSPFVAAKQWELFNVEPQDLVLTELTGSEEMVALEFIDYSDGTGTGSLNSECNIALEQQSDDLAIPEEGVSGSGTFFPDSEEINANTGTFKRLLYTQIQRAFYNDYRNPTEIFGLDNIDLQLSGIDRFISNEFVMFTIPQNVFGDRITEKSVVLYDTNFNDNITIQDDGFGNLMAGDNLFSKVQEIKRFGNSIDNGFASQCTSSILSPPTNLMASSGSVILTWNAVDDADQFVIQKSVNRGGTWTTLTTISSSQTTYTDTAVSSSVFGSRYTYRIQSINAVTSSFFGNTASIGFSSSYVNYNLAQIDLVGATSLPVGKENMSVYAHGNTIYLYGGDRNPISGGAVVGTADIWTASVDTPNIVGDSGFTLPSTMSYAMIVPISGTLYMYSGQFTDRIMTASISNPLLWGDAGVRFPIQMGNAQAIVIGNKIWFLGGSNDALGSAFNSASYTASTDSPLNIGFAGLINLGMEQHSLVGIGDKLYQIGGAVLGNGDFVPARQVMTCSVSNPLHWGTGSTTLMPGGSRPLVAIGNTMYSIAGYTGGTGISATLFSITASNPFSQITFANMPSASHYHRALALTMSNGTPYVVVYGGGSGDSSIAKPYVFTGSVTISSSLSPTTDYNYPDWMTLKGVSPIVTTVP